MPAILAIVAGCLLAAGCSTSGGSDAGGPDATSSTTTTEDRSVIGSIEEPEDEGDEADDEDCLTAAGFDDGVDWYFLLVTGRNDPTGSAKRLDDVFRCYRDEANSDQIRAGFGEAFDHTYGTDLDDDEVACLLDRVAEFPNPGTTLLDPVAAGRADRLVEDITACADTNDVLAATSALFLDDEVENPEFDAFLLTLKDACVTDDRACDLLYIWSDRDSELEAFAADCNGREPGTEEYCTDGLTLVDGLVDPNAPGITRLGEQCHADEGLACDLLYELVDIDHPLFLDAETCNGRLPDGPVMACYLEI